MSEAYVSFETAKLLKEKGFDEPCNHYYFYGTLKEVHYYERNSEAQYLIEAEHCTAPTQQMAMRWLREAKGIYLSVRLNAFAESKDEVGGYWWFVDILDANKGEWIDNGINKVGYEKAVEAALIYTLEKLI